MRKLTSFDLAGMWFRWTRYDLVDGVVIPADGADLEQYDPWHEFRSNEGRYRTVEQPYTPFLELARALKSLADRSIVPSLGNSNANLVRGPQNEADDLILTWCNRHGLLGLVPVLSNSIIQTPGLVLQDGKHVAYVNHSFRDGGRWKFAIRSGSPASNAEDALRHLEQYRLKPGITWFNLYTNLYEEDSFESLRRYWSPEAQNSFEPFVLTDPSQHGWMADEFWKHYGEPVSEVGLWCNFFERAVELTSDRSGVAEIDLAERSCRMLNGLAQGAAPSFRFDPKQDTFYEERASAGLLASYALMFLWDRVASRRAFRCRNCQRYFVSNEHRAGYCSSTCRNTAQSRRYRAKRKLIQRG